MRRRRFLHCVMLPLLAAAGVGAKDATDSAVKSPVEQMRRTKRAVKLFLCGDVMTGRGIDQILPHPSSPEIYESYLTSADQYVEVAERVRGAIPREVDFSYVWGDALPLLQAAEPDARIVNLETAVTTSSAHWQGKGINYRMHPQNIPVLTAAGIDACALANNHVLDWGYDGLTQTLDVLRGSGIATAGAGADAALASAPAVIEAGARRRVMLLSLGHGSSGIPETWEAETDRPGVWLLGELSADTIDQIGEIVSAIKESEDIAVASMHWGGNWGYEIPAAFRRFAHGLLDHAGIDLVHGHSSHHPRGMEVYKGRLILYGCGDFINDYEGIRGHESWRGDLRVMYMPHVEPGTGQLKDMSLHVFQSHKFRLHQAGDEDLDWLQGELDRETRRIGDARVVRQGESLALKWG